MHAWVQCCGYPCIARRRLAAVSSAAKAAGAAADALMRFLRLLRFWPWHWRQLHE